MGTRATIASSEDGRIRFYKEMNFDEIHVEFETGEVLADILVPDNVWRDLIAYIVKHREWLEAKLAEKAKQPEARP